MNFELFLHRTDKSSGLTNKGQSRGLGSLQQPVGESSSVCEIPVTQTGSTTNTLAQIQPPAPMPRKSQISKTKPKRVKAIYNCVADNPDELTFSEGDIIVVDGEEDQEWWIGHIDGDPSRKGAFPVSFVHFIVD